MTRAIIELLFTVFIIMVARALLTSFFKGIGNAATGFGQQQQQQQAQGERKSAPVSGSELHKDPICGTYVPESTQHQRRISGQTFYYCSEACQAKHALAAR